jgi:hypothetical protein
LLIRYIGFSADSVKHFFQKKEDFQVNGFRGFIKVNEKLPARKSPAFGRAFRIRLEAL